MAKVTVIREKPQPPAVREVILALSEEEAAAIAVLAGRLPAGDPLTTSTYVELRDAGVGWGSPTYRNVKRKMGL